MAVTALQTGVATAEDGAPYVGAKLGGYQFDKGPVDVNDFAAGFYFGYRFNRYVSVEGEWVYLIPDDIVFGDDFNANVWVASVRPSYPLNDSWEVYAKLGWGWIDAEIDREGSFTNQSEEDDDFVWGLGTSWLGEKYHFRAEVQADTDVPDFLIYTIGAGLKF